MSEGPEPGQLTPRHLALLLIGLVVLSALSYFRLREESRPVPKLTVLSGETMGTTYTVKIVATPEQDVARQKYMLAIGGMLGYINHLTSTYDPKSELSQFNASDSTEAFEVSEATALVFEAALKVSDQSAGAFDITVGPIVNAYGFGPEARASTPDDAELARLFERVGYDKVEVDVASRTVRKSQPDVYCDLSALAKGYAVDEIVRLLERDRLRNYFVEVGGEIRARGRNEHGEVWSIGIETPVETERSIYRVLPVEDASVATSGDYRNFYEEGGKRISHTIDARTGRPVEHALASVTVLHESCMMADAYATAIMVLGPEDGYLMAEILELPALLILRGADGSFEDKTSPAFDALYGAKAN